MLVEKDITVFSNCEHHFVPIYGKAHVAYISSGEVIGLSKLNRIVQYYSKRPQVQERLTVQIANELREVLKTEGRGGSRGRTTYVCAVARHSGFGQFHDYLILWRQNSRKKPPGKSF